MKSFYPITGIIKNYAWGSLDGISAATGISIPKGLPVAEFWMGAHRNSSSSIIEDDILQPQSLLDFITTDPDSVLGAEISHIFSGKLPFLFKVLSASSPLSIQAHPSKKQAEAGFLRENRSNIAVDSPLRNYRDDNHKPEIILALTPFTALCGLRPITETAKLLRAASFQLLSELADQLESSQEYSTILKTMLEIPADYVSEIIQNLALSHDLSIQDTVSLARYLHTCFPGDRGALAPLYLNIIQILPGEALYLPPGNLHAYINGTGLELMANSDNVIRSGLTEKHTDIQEILSIIDMKPLDAVKIGAPSTTDRFYSYTTDSKDFELIYISITPQALEWTADRPGILICTNGQALMETTSAESRSISAGSVLFLPASGNTIKMSGSGLCYLATIPGKILL